MTKHLLLISNSISFGQKYLDHCVDEIVDFLGSIKKVLFIPYAVKNPNSYFLKVEKRLKKVGLVIENITSFRNQRSAVKKAKAIFVGGGNTFRLLNELYKNGLVSVVRDKVNNGLYYIGISAGTNVACPTIKTTNDMPIIHPPSLNALDLVSFQINPHYCDTTLGSKHMGETRDQRIEEFQEENNSIVIGLREGACLRIENNVIELKGENGAKIFYLGKKPKEYKIGKILL